MRMHIGQPIKCHKDARLPTVTRFKIKVCRHTASTAYNPPKDSRTTRLMSHAIITMFQHQGSLSGLLLSRTSFASGAFQASLYCRVGRRH